MNGSFEHYFLLAAAAWLVLQLLALRQLRGGWRTAAWISAVAMGLAVAVAALGTAAGSNIAPIWVALALPLCLVWIVAVWLTRGIALLVSH